MREWSETEAGRAYREAHNKYAREWRKKNKEKFRATQKRAYDKMRLEVLTHYSQGAPCCRCCGESHLQFLSLDHIDGNGADHRRQIGQEQGAGVQRHRVNVGGNGLPYWLKKNGYPEGFQVLCMNCNFAKSDKKYCPHELEAGVDMHGNPIVDEN